MHIKVHVEVQRAAEALDQGHHAALRRRAVNACLVRQPVPDHALHDGQHRANRLWLAGEQPAQRKRNAQHPLPHPARAKHVLHQMPRALGHAACAAARAEPALLARKRHQPLGVAVRAHHAQEAVIEHAAAQVRLERLAYVGGQRAVLGRHLREEVGVMRLYEGVQQLALGRVAGVGRCC
jgi:hypothetical protein